MRQEALKWWRNLDSQAKRELADKHKPDWTFDMVNNSSSTIEKIFAKRIPDQEA